MISVNQQHADSPWPHRWAVVLACATFPLVWVGGLVTTTDAGMAVPDWPNTYGYNLFLYPWQTWLAGPWDLFVEHGHRLLGATVGLLTILLLASLWRSDRRPWVRWFGLAALALVILQGVLGGMRVLLDERTLAMLHGCTGPLFFALAVSLAVVTSKSWHDPSTGRTSDGWRPSPILRPLAVITAAMFYLQLVLGAVLRHVPASADPIVFSIAVKFHLLLAAVLAVHVGWLAWAITRHRPPLRPLRGLAWLLVGLVFVQIVLGAGTWLVKYSVPYWGRSWLPLSNFTIQADGWLQTHVTTAHVAVGSLLLATSVALALYALRTMVSSRPAQQPAHGSMRVAV